MSTIVMSQATTVYDFGDLFLKNAQNGFNKSHNQEPVNTSLHQLAVGTSPALSPRQLHSALSRVSSSPAAALVSSLLDNLNHRRLERTQSAPVATQIQSAAANTSRYKTELCRPYEESGACKYGDKCQFAHGLAELRSLARHPKYKTELCRTYHTAGFCPYGPRCHFVHNEEEARIHNRAVAAFLAARVNSKQRPPALSPTLSSSDSPNSSLSQSPTSSLGSFFSSETEISSPAVSPSVSLHSPSPPPQQQSPTDEWRLPVFNRLSANMLSFGDLIL